MEVDWAEPVFCLKYAPCTLLEKGLAQTAYSHKVLRPVCLKKSSSSFSISFPFSLIYYVDVRCFHIYQGTVEVLYVINGNLLVFSLILHVGVCMLLLVLTLCLTFPSSCLPDLLPPLFHHVCVVILEDHLHQACQPLQRGTKTRCSKTSLLC